MRSGFSNTLSKVMFIVAIFTAACTPAQDNAHVTDPDAKCVWRAGDMAYCIIRGEPFICDDKQCLPAICPAATVPILESGNGTKHDR